VVIAMVLGAYWAGVVVTPLPGLIALASGSALLVTVLAALWPARTAARLDPCLCFQEV